MLFALSACGGGGHSGPPPAPVAPTAVIVASTDHGAAPLSVTFDGADSRDPDGSIASFQWDFGDASAAATGMRVSHTYSDPGSYTATLRVTDDGGLSGSATQSIRVSGATISGVVQIGPNTRVDSDVNDRFTRPVPNNSFGTAQVVGNPLLLGGFVNVPGSGSVTGTFHDSGDVDDFFAVHLNGDERLVLSIGDPGADLDLEIYSDEPQPRMLGASISPDPMNDPTEDLSAPGSGDFFVHVKAVSGASNYVLSIAKDSGVTSLRRRAKRLSDPFVPGDVLVAARRRGLVHRYRVRRAGGRGNRLTSSNLAAPAPDLALPELHLPPGATISAADAERYRTLLAARYLHVQQHMSVVEVNVLRKPMQIPNDPLYAQQWNYEHIHLPQAWDVTTGKSGTPVVIAVVDTGVLLHHPDLTGKLLRNASGGVIGYDFVADPQRANDGDGIDPNPDDPGDNADGAASGSYHGTHVAGIAAAATDNAGGVAGVSWGARIMPVRALGIDGGTTFDVMQAVRYAAGLSNVSGTIPPVRADIVNMSLGSDFYSEAEQQTLNDVRTQGVFLVASAGNSGSNIPSYPASYDGVVSVAASTIDDQVAGYSNFGTFIDVTAPGGGSVAPILSTLGQGAGDQLEYGYGYLAGTSMAAPHVSGVIALMKSVYPQMTPAEFDALLQQERLTRDAGAPDRDDHYGWGIIDAYQSVLEAESLMNGVEVPAIISVSASTLDFQQFTRAFDFSVSNVGDVATTVSVSDDADWLSVTQGPATADGFGQYQAVVDRSTLPDGSYRATITVESPDPTVSPAHIQVVMQVVSADATADAGQQYVVLTTPDRTDSVALDTVTAHNGEYRFLLQDVPPGDYRLFSGTDLNDDDTICDGGEACGAYPNLSTPAIIHVEGSQSSGLTGLTFASEFRSIATPTGAAANAGPGGGAKGITLPRRDRRP